MNHDTLTIEKSWNMCHDAKNMVTSPVGALECCQFWNEPFSNISFEFATLVGVSRTSMKLLKYMTVKIPCNAVKKWLLSVENTARVIKFHCASCSTPFFLWRSASFCTQLSKFMEQTSRDLLSPVTLVEVGPKLLLLDLAKSFRNPLLWNSTFRMFPLSI